MRWAWALVVLGTVLLAPCASADPALSSAEAGLSRATWTFSNPASYTVDSVSLGGSGARLAWYASVVGDTSLADFSAATSTTNVDLLSSPGDVVLANASRPGPVQSVLFQPGASAMADNYLYKGNGGSPNFGTSPELRAGNWGGGEWTRGLLQFPATPLPANTTLVAATLELYLYDPITAGPMDFSVHRMTAPWTELGSNWDTRDGVTPWNATGGDFDPTAVDVVAGIGTTPGWYGWNVTSLVQGWLSGTVSNQGLMVRQVGDNTTVLGEKGFYSSDAANGTVRPRLLLNYTTPASLGTFVSRAFSAGGVGTWGTISWNATVPSGAALAVRTRTGSTYPADATWSAWSPAYPTPGATIASPPGEYLEYELDLFTPDDASPSVHDVNVTYGRFAVAGHVTMQPFGPSGLAGWDRLAINAVSPAGTTVSAELSQDDGASWVPAGDGEDLSAALPQAILLRLDLLTTNATVSPVVASVSVTYRTAGGGLAGAVLNGFPWWLLLLIPVGLFLAFAYRRRSAGFVPTGLYLIHTGGRLVAHVGREPGMRDELAASAMLTLVLRFVEDSFGGAKGGGELREFKVDENEIVIAKGTFLYLALVGAGALRPGLSERMRTFLAGLETMYGARLQAWNGMREGLEGLDADLAWFLETGHRQPRHRRAAGYHA